MGLRAADNSFDPEGADQWNQIIYKKIAVLGDSLSAQRPICDDTWPVRLQDRINSAGGVVQVKNFSTGSHSFFRANTVDTYESLNGGDDMTAVEAVIAWKPDVVIVVLGANDVAGSVLGTGDNRSEAEIQADAQLTYTTLKAGLPNAVLIQANERFFDEDNFTTSNVKNKGVLPNLMTPKAAGILTNLNSSEMLDDNCSTNTKDILDTYDALMAVIDAIDGVNMLELNLFRVSRLGTSMVDRAHYTPFGHTLVTGYFIKGLRDIPDFVELVPVIASQPTGTLFEGEDPDELFEDALDASGDGYVAAAVDTTGAEDVDSSWGMRVLRADKWYLAYKASFVLHASTIYNTAGWLSLLNYSVHGAQPNTAVTYSIDGASFSSLGLSTDQFGNLIANTSISVLNLSNASHDFRFKIGSDVFGPFSITVSADILGNVALTNVGNVGTGEDDLMTFTIPAGFAFADVGRGIRVVQHGTFANNANAKTVRIKFGGTTVATLSLTTNLAGQWQITWYAHATGDDAQKLTALATIQTAASTWITVPLNGTSTENDDAAIVIKATGEATSNNDIIQTFQRVYYE